MNWKDKFTKMKDGDMVIKYKPYNSSKYCFYGGNKCDVPLGTIGVIEKIKDTYVTVKFNNGITWSLDITELQKV